MMYYLNKHVMGTFELDGETVVGQGLVTDINANGSLVVFNESLPSEQFVLKVEDVIDVADEETQFYPEVSEELVE